jgi:uncharacterized membrane protein
MVAVLARNMRHEGLRRGLLDSLTFLLPVGIVAVVAYIPWYIHFSSQAGGLEPYIGEGTRPAHAFLQFGPLGIAALLVLTWVFRRGDRDLTFNSAVLALWVPMIPFALWLILSAAHGDLTNALNARRPGGWVTLIMYGASTWLLVAAALVLRARSHAGAAVAAIAAVGALLLFGAELFYIHDIFSGSPRLNTIFKLSYQAWMLLSVAGSVALVTALHAAWKRRVWSGWLSVPAAVLVAAGLVYAVISLPNRTEDFSNETGIDGLSSLAQNAPDEYALTRWVQDNTAPNATLIEASGRQWRTDDKGQAVIDDSNGTGLDYSDAGRIASRTRRSTLIGWYFHEIQWRGDSDAIHAELDKREALIDGVYTKKDPANVLKTMKDTGAEYVVVGQLELQKYPAQFMPDFSQFLDTVFQSGDMRVYRLPSYEVTQTS